MATKKSDPRIAVIGAGMTGVICASELSRNGFKPVVFEKSWDIGGRMSTRKTRDGLTFDHGAQYVRGKTPEFLHVLHELTARGSVTPWEPRAHAMDEFDPTGVVVGAPIMRFFSKPYADELDIRFNARVESAHFLDEEWQLVVGDELLTFDYVISTIPAPQADQLFGSVLDGDLARVEIDPCWALMIAFDAKLPVDFDVWRNVNEDVGWIARNASKPDRGVAETWVVHASSNWSLANLERDKESVATDLQDLFFEALGLSDIKPNYVTAHRWRYAQTKQDLGQNFLHAANGSLLVGGDWCLGGRVEFAFQSGKAIGDHLIAELKE